MFLGLDFGTGSVKALLLNASGDVVGEASKSYDVVSPNTGWAETEPAAWWQAVCKAVRSLAASDLEQVKAIGLSGQMHGVVLCDEDGTPLRNAILWAEIRAPNLSYQITRVWQLNSNCV